MHARRFAGAFVVALLASILGMWATILVPPIGLPAATVLGIALLLRSADRWATGGGLLMPIGGWSLYLLRGAVERCAEIDRSPTGSCEIYGVPDAVVAMSLVIVAGALLTGYAGLRALGRRAG